MKKDSSLKTMGSLKVSDNPRAAHADISNAPELFGDVFGDINDETLSGFSIISGDVDDYGDIDEEGDLYGDPSRRKKLALAAAAAGLSVAAFLALKKRQANKNKRIARQMAQASTRQTLENQKLAKQSIGVIDRHKKLPFFEVLGAKMNASPIDSMECFIADMWKFLLDRQAADTPFFQETAVGVYGIPTPNVWTATATGVATPRFYTALIVQIGINQLAGAPGTVFQVSGTFPIINGSLAVTTGTPFVFTIEKGFDVRFKLFPWQLVANKPFPVLGQYDNANNIVVNVSGLPNIATVNLIVPGSLHPWIAAMRTALIKG